MTLLVVAASLVFCEGCGASQTKYHYCHSLNGGSMRGFAMIQHKRERDDARQAAR